MTRHKTETEHINKALYSNPLNQNAMKLGERVPAEIEDMTFHHQMHFLMSVVFHKEEEIPGSFTNLQLHFLSSLVLFAHSLFQKWLNSCNFVVMANVTVSCRRLVAFTQIAVL